MAQSSEPQKDQNSSSIVEDRRPNIDPGSQPSLLPDAPGKTKRVAAKVGLTKQTDSLVSKELAEHPQLPSKLQPTKLFLSKCQKELDALLETIEKDYHQELKSLYTKEIYTDLFVAISEVRKPLHKCIVASRAYKLYCALRIFSIESTPLEKDIIISNFQQDLTGQRIQDSSTKHENQNKQIDTKEFDLSILDCLIPEGLFSAELFATFVRRIYLNQDISSEEETLHKRIVDWLKEMRPEFVKVLPKHLQDNRESFRTIQPDYDQASPLVRSPIMTPEIRATSNSEDVESIQDELDDSSQAASARDDSSNFTTLTRTDTFELISKNSNQDSPQVSSTIRSLIVDTNEDETESSEPTKELLSSNAPTTRTGLKPRTFTSPIGSSPISVAAKSKNKSEPSDSQDLSVIKQSSQAQVKSSIKAKPAASSFNSTKKSGSDTSSSSSKLPEPRGTRTPLSVRTNIATPSKSKTPAALPRAHPISLERSQSPGTNIIKGTGKNFISSNKRMISQLEKKNQIQQVATQNLDSDADISESSLYLVESLTSDNMVAHMDKFTLVSRSKLADALARLFIDGRMADAMILVRDGKKLNAHICILAARSAYLAEIIDTKLSNKSWEENGRCKLEIDLTDYSLNSVNFALMHIYSGAARIPEDIELEDLTKLSHLLHVTTLNQVCIHNLKMNLCHYFHKPCNVCCLGVLRTLPLAWRYDYSDLYSRCLQWIGSNFASIFCLKEFSELKPQDLVEECYNATLSQLTPDNIIAKTIECQRLLKNLPRVKWTDSVICLVGRQLEDFCLYVASNYEKILQSESFLNLSKNCWECEILEENLLAAMNHLKPDTGCRTLIQLHKIECSIESVQGSAGASDSFANLIAKMRRYCERYLLKDAAAVVHCSSWRHMSPTLQKRIKDQAIISTDFDEPTKQLASKPKLPSMSRVGRKSSSPNPGASGEAATPSPSNRSTPESRLKSPNTTLLPAPRNKVAAARHVKILK